MLVESAFGAPANKVASVGDDFEVQLGEVLKVELVGIVDRQPFCLLLGEEVLEGVDAFVEVELSLARVGDDEPLLIEFTVVHPELFAIDWCLFHFND